jgi:hypothetical protein
MGFLEGTPTSEEEKTVAEALDLLRDMLVDKITLRQMFSVPTIMWLVTIARQCLIRRTLEAVDGIRSSWSSGNLLTSVTMARSLFETGATFWALADSIEKAVDDRDEGALRYALVSVCFGTRLAPLIGPGGYEFKAQNVLTTIDRMDKAFPADKKVRYRFAYDWLSEFVHPNYCGIVGLYCDWRRLKYGTEFQMSTQEREELRQCIEDASVMVALVASSAMKIDRLSPVIEEFVPKVIPPFDLEPIFAILERSPR